MWLCVPRQAHRCGEWPWAASNCLPLLKLTTGIAHSIGPWSRSAGRHCLSAGTAIPLALIPHRQLKSCMVSTFNLFAEASLGSWAGCSCCMASWGSVRSLCWASFHHYPYSPLQYLHTWKHMDSTEAIPSLFIQQTTSISLQDNKIRGVFWLRTRPIEFSIQNWNSLAWQI